MIKKLADKYYNLKVEDFCVRLLYFFNTLDTYFIVAGLLSYLILTGLKVNILCIVLITIAVWGLFKIADFYPVFIFLSPIPLIFLFLFISISLTNIFYILLINFCIFIIIQFCFMGLPESIVARDFTIGIRKIKNSFFTIAPTTVSMSISLFFSTFYSLVLFTSISSFNIYVFLFWLSFIIISIITYFFIPKSFISKNFKPEPLKKISEKVIVINIDGCRLDRFYEAKLPFLSSLTEHASYFPNGIQTVYRALTNPAFASMLTGSIPKVHGIKNNNLNQEIKVLGLPDLVKTKLYGSMHIQHFSKQSWDTKVVSLPYHGVYKSDDIMFDWLKKDILKDDDTRLFITDISETDFLGHAYGSESKHYLDALKRADKRIESFFSWLWKNNKFKDTTIIITSDHGIYKIDHSYLCFKPEKYVPFFIVGDNIKKNNPLKFDASIMDIALTISYILKLPYPETFCGRVLIETIKET